MPENTFVSKNESWKCSICGIVIRFVEIPHSATLEERRVIVLHEHNRVRLESGLPKCEAGFGDIVFEAQE